MSNTTANLHKQPSKKLALLAHQLRATEHQSFTSEPIAIIGMGCRFPGGVINPEQFWQFLQRGGNGIVEIPTERWPLENYYDANPDVPGKSYSRWGGFLQDIDQFDPVFFSISPREAQQMDPRQRLLLETAWEALEAAAYAPESLSGSLTGVFVGHMVGDYHALLGDNLQAVDSYVSTGVLDSLLANRLSYTLNLQGPSLSVDTACSSALTALYLACQSLRQNECNLALVGGVNLMLSPEMHVIGAKAGILSPKGRCSTFSNDADGFVRGEGCGVIVVKRLADALLANDTIMAVVRGAAVNQDGRTNGIAAPNGFSQQRVIKQALHNALLEASQITFIESHGTGTLVGDPIEVEALTEIYGAPSPQGPCFLGAVKTNVGHLEGAAGIASIIKMVLCLQNKTIPPNINFNGLNPHIRLDQTRFELPLKAQAWATSHEPRRGAVSSFGIGGTNGHIILEEAPHPIPSGIQKEQPWHLVSLSAKTPVALSDLIKTYQEYIASYPSTCLADLAYTTNTGRNHFNHRTAVVASSIESVATQLQQTQLVNKSQVDLSVPKTAFLFTGQGAQYAGMAQELYETQPRFKQTLDYCASLLQAELPRPLLDVLYPAVDEGLVNETAYTQPALFAVEYALANLWQSWGIRPDWLIGHSVGEYVAACIAGVFSLEDGLRLIAARGRLMQALPHNGAMVAVIADEATAKSILRPYSQSVSIAAVNSPRSVVLSGEANALQTVVEQLQAKGIETKSLTVSHAFHSALMEPMLAEFEQVAQTISYHAPHISLISNLTGKPIQEDIAQAAYWVRHVREAVRFADGMASLQAQGCNVFIEIGPKPTLTGLGQQCITVANGVWVASLKSEQSDWQQLLTGLGRLYERGLTIDWLNVDSHYQRRKLALPTYPFQRQRYWLAESPVIAQQSNSALRPLLNKITRSPLLKETLFEASFSLNSLPFLADHQVYGEVVVPGACYVATLLSAAEVMGYSICQLDDVLFPGAMVLQKNEHRSVHLVLKPEGKQSNINEQAAFELVSLTDGSNAKPQTHMIGQLHWQMTGASSPATLAELQARCRQAIDPEGFYATAREQQIVFGPSFRWLQTLWLGAGEILGQLRLPNTLANLNGYVAHPALLDACFQVAASTLLDQDEKETWLPFLIRHIRFHQPATGTHWWCHAKQRGEHIWDICLFDADGSLLMEFFGFEERPVPSEALLGKRLWEDWLYKLEWQAQNQNSVLALPEAQSWLIFADDIGLGNHLAAQVVLQGGTAILVFSESTYTQKNNQTYSIDANRAEDYQKLLATLPDAFNTVFLWPLNTPDLSNGELPRSTEQVCAHLLYLTQALAVTHQTAKKLWVITSQGQAINSDDKPQNLAQASLWGMASVIRMEHPDIGCVTLDLPEGDLEFLGSTLWAELNTQVPIADVHETRIAYRDNQRYVARLVRHTLQPSKSIDDKPILSINSEATYLITGGTGGLGLKMIHWLVEQGAKHLVLVARHLPRLEIQQQLDALTQAGCFITVAQANSADKAQLSQVIANIEKDYPLKGIIHAAGILDDGVISQQNRQRFARVLAPKVEGAWHLHTLTQDLPLDFFVLFSSMTSVLGGMGQVNYAAANAFLDALAHYRQNLGLPALSINWGGWSEVGMAATMADAERQRLLQYGESLISPDQGTDIFAELLQQSPAQISVFPIEWPAYLTKTGRSDALLQPFTSVPTKPSEAQEITLTSWRQTIESAPKEKQQGLLLDYLRSVVAKILNLLSPDRIELRQGLKDLGLDSITSIEVRNRLAKELDCSLPATLLFDYPTVETLAIYLSENVLSLTEASTTAALAQTYKPFDDDLAALLSDIEQISDTDIQRQWIGMK